MSVAIGAAVWRATDSPIAVPVAVATGALIDSDHATDIFDSTFMGRGRHMVRLFHAWEYTAAGFLALAFWQHPILMAAVLGHLSHMVIDQTTNNVGPLSYSMVYRIKHRFNRARLTPQAAPDAAAQPPTPTWGRAEPTLWRLYLLYKRSRFGRPRGKT